MLYDTRSDKYTDLPVGDPEVLAEATTRVSQETFKVKTVEDSFIEKANCLEIDNELQLSVLSGLVDVQGAAKFLTARRSSMDQTRISLVCQSTTKLEELNLDKLASLCADISGIDTATHIVTKVQYGANAAFVFDASGYAYDDLLAKISELKNSLSTSSAVVHTAEKKEADITCTFYADIPCPKEPATFSEASLLCHTLASHLEGKGHSVPVKIWLCPLGVLNNRAHKLLLREVSPKLTETIQTIFDSLNESEIRSKHVMNSEVCKHFLGIKSDLKNMIRMLADYNLLVRNRLASLLPQVREGAADVAKLVEVLDDNKNSPFCSTVLRNWIEEKETEVKVLLTYIRTFEQEKQIRFAFQPDDMHVLSNSMDIDTIVCFDFNIIGDRDNQLANMRAHLTGKEATCTPHNQEDSPSQQWYNTKEMHRQARLFKKLAADNVKQGNIAFAVTSGGSEVAKKSNQRPCLSLYTEDSEPKVFELPGKPGKPQAFMIGSSSIQLMWDRPKFGASSVKSYTILYHSTDDQPDRWYTCSSKNDKTTISGLLPSHEYVFKIRAKAETTVLDGPESEPSDPIATRAPLQPPGKPYAANITHCSLTLQWTKPQSGHEQNIKFYTICYRTSHDPPDEWKTHKTSDAQEKTNITDLSSATTYFFKVRAESNFGFSPESEVSDAFETKKQFLIAPPGKPSAATVTHNSITLEWTIPENRDKTCFPYHIQAKFQNGVQAYTINYRSINDPPTWLSHTTKNPAQQCEISNLNPETKYVFKVTALTSTESSQVSEVSNEIQTKPQPNPTETDCIKKSPVHETKCALSDLQESSKESSVPSESTNHTDTKVSLSCPGKPHATCVTHNSIQLKWDKPQNGADEKDALYTLYVHSDKDPQNKWSTCSTTNDDSFLVESLQQNTTYIFKVSAKGSSGHCQESVVSDLIKTKLGLSPPGKPYAHTADVTHNSIQLKWDKPTHGAEMVETYKIFFRSTLDLPNNWSSISTAAVTEEYVTVPLLEQQTAYIFKVSAETSTGYCEVSEVSDPIATKMYLSPPGKPYATQKTSNSVQLKWERPNSHAENTVVLSYRIFCCQSQSPDWFPHSNIVTQESFYFPKLRPDSMYYFKVSAETETKVTSESEVSDPIKTDDLPPGEKLLPFCCEIIGKSKKLSIYQLPTTLIMTRNEIVKVNVGVHPISVASQNKVLMLVGATGAGKSTLINGIANYILGVKWKDKFRFRLISEETSQTSSQTRHITAYSFHQQSSILPYTLTVIDTPGFGDTRGLERDKKIHQLIKEFFSNSGNEGIDQVNAIGFVAQANLSRLTPTQKYIFDTVLTIFGKDIGSNIFLMTTFADGHNPQVLAAVKAAEVPFQNHFKFNNSALFASNSGDSVEFDAMFWQMGIQSFASFFDQFSSVEPRSLTLTRQVLEEREQLETMIQGLQPRIRTALAKIDELKQEESILQQHKDAIDSSKNFTYTVTKTERNKIKLPKNTYTTTCQTCDYTCHDYCTKSNDSSKKSCYAMKTGYGTRNAHCGVCPNKCHWSEHVNTPYKYEYYQVEVTRTWDNIKSRYESAMSGKSEKESVIANLTEEIEKHKNEALGMIKEVKQCLQRLNEIALKPTSMTEVEYIDLLIDSTKQEEKPGWQQEVKTLQQLRQKAAFQIQLANNSDSISEQLQ